MPASHPARSLHSGLNHLFGKWFALSFDNSSALRKIGVFVRTPALFSKWTTGWLVLICRQQSEA
jgi:hypothetical protein